ncbi:hypothetical protein GH714_000849 [Hevea brasiliensis]|uniref:Uncharacterized protein n=1 Tax=Hevea brasiliensis TaxID=3981 RepID=A0A6A6KEX6_HEVBR|nr:hypothetical protein GH714_000849 [Hevea brasiliensis]
MKAIGKQIIMKEEYVKRSSHYAEYAPTAIYTSITQHASHRSSNKAPKQDRRQPNSNSRTFDRNYRHPNPHGKAFDRDHRQPPRYVNNEHVDIARKVKLDAPEYDGKLDSNAFIDCTSNGIGKETSNSHSVVFYCHDKGHIAFQCPHRALALNQACEDEYESEHNSPNYKEEVTRPIDYSSYEDDLDIDDEHFNGGHCVLSTIVDDD